MMPVEMVEIPDVDFDQHVGEIRSAPDHAQVVDVAVGIADYVGDLRQCSGFVDSRDADQGGKTLGFLRIDIPGHINPVCTFEFTQLRRMNLKYLDAFVRNEHTDDAVAGHSAALLKRDWQIPLEAANRYASGVLTARQLAV